jgi:transcriptional regulator with XRE-family HTH domain
MAASFGEELRALRNAKGMSSTRLAKSVDWSQVHVCEVERGESRPPAPEKIRTILRALAAEDRFAEFCRLAATYRSKVVMRIAPGTDDDVRETLILIGDAHSRGEIDRRVAGRLRRALERSSAA